MTLKSPLSVKESLAKLEETPEEMPEIDAPNVPQNPFEGLQMQISSIHITSEALIDLLIAFGALNLDVVQIACQNVAEFDHMHEDTINVLPLRLKSLKKKLAEYSKSQKATKGKRKNA